MTKLYIREHPFSKLPYQTIGSVIDRTVRGLDRKIVDDRWLLASLFARVSVDHNRRGLWISTRKEVSGPTPTEWPTLLISEKSAWDYDDVIIKSINKHSPELVVMDFRGCWSYMPLDKTVATIKERQIDHLLITSDLPLNYLRESLGAPKKSYPAAIHYPAVSTPGPHIPIGDFDSKDDRIAYAYLLGKLNTCALQRARTLIELSSRHWLHGERRLVLTGTDVSAYLIADTLKNGPPKLRGTSNRKKTRNYTPFHCPAYIRVIESASDVDWFRNNKRPNHLIIPMDRLGKDPPLLEKLVGIASEKVVFAFLVTPPAELLGVYAWRLIRSRLRMCVKIGWGLEDILFFRWRRKVKTIEGAAELVSTLKEARNVKNSVKSDPKYILTAGMGTV